MRGDRKKLAPRDIRTARQLRRARRDLEMELWYTRQQLESDVRAIFSLQNLVSIFMPTAQKVSLATQIVRALKKRS